MADDDRTPLVREAVAGDLEQMICTHPAREAISASALRLAYEIDRGEADGKELAALAKELRAHLDDLAGRVAGDDDDLADLLGPELSAEVRDAEES